MVEGEVLTQLAPTLGYNLRGDNKWVLISGETRDAPLGYFYDTVNTENLPPIEDVACSNITATTARISFSYPSTWDYKIKYSINVDMSDALWSVRKRDIGIGDHKLLSLLPNTSYYVQVYVYVPWSDAYYTTSEIKSFITLSSQNHIIVNSGESIQDAIDMLPTEGGTVELSEGTWQLFVSASGGPPIEIIRRNNVTLKGAGSDKTVISTSETDICAIIASPLDDNDFMIHEVGGGAAQSDPRLKNAPFYSNITIKDLKIVGPGVYVEAGKSIIGILFAKMENSAISNVVIDKFGYGTMFYRCDNNMVNENDIINSNKGALFFSHTPNSTIQNCLFENAGRWYAIDLNGYGCNNKIINNIFKGNHQGCLKIYSASMSNEIYGNTFDGGGTSQIGVYLIHSGDNLVRNNVFTNYRDVSNYAVIIQTSDGTYLHDNKIVNNVF